LRDDIQEYIEEIIEPGNEHDYVTMNHLIGGYMFACPDAKQHHYNQINQAFTSIMSGKGKHVSSVIIPNDIPPDEQCMGCGEYTEYGYVDAYQFVKLKSGKKCGYNYECTCVRGNAFSPFHVPMYI
jgi:hypothetical protein